MPFTLFVLRILGMLLIVLLAGAMLDARALCDLAAQAMVWLALLAVPVFIAEAFGFLRRAARFFFGAPE